MFVVLILLLGVVIAYLVLKGAIQTRRGRLVVLGRPLRSRLNKLAGRGFVLSPIEHPPIELEATSRIFQSLGFEFVTLGSQTRYIVTAIFAHEPGCVIAEASWQRMPQSGQPRTLILLLSTASERRGALVTGNSGFDFAGPLWRMDQVFPHASIDVLVDRHEEARRRLEGRGVRFDPVGPSDAVDALGWHRSKSIASLLELTNDGLADYSMRRARNRYQEPVTLESKLGDPETTAWIEAMRAEAPSP